MAEFVGFSREIMSENHGIELIPDFIREEIRLEISQVFGNCKHDILLTTDIRKHDKKPYESILNYYCIVDSITPQMMEHFDSSEKFGIYIDKIKYETETNQIMIYVKCTEFWAKIRCARRSRDRPTDRNRVEHHKEPPYQREIVY